jgi:hypothetical protein
MKEVIGYTIVFGIGLGLATALPIHTRTVEVVKTVKECPTETHVCFPLTEDPRRHLFEQFRRMGEFSSR